MKLRKSINISIVSKKYIKEVNDVLDLWEEKGVNPSHKICELIINNNNVDKSPSLSNIINTYQMIRTSLSRYLQDEELEVAIEEVFSKMFTLNANYFSQLMMNPKSLLNDKSIGVSYINNEMNYEHNLNQNIDENTNENVINQEENKKENCNPEREIKEEVVEYVEGTDYDMNDEDFMFA